MGYNYFDFNTVKVPYRLFVRIGFAHYILFSLALEFRTRLESQLCDQKTRALYNVPTRRNRDEILIK